MNKLFVKFGKDSCSEILREIESPIYSSYDITWIKSILRKDNDFVVENFKHRSAEKWKRFYKAKVKIMSTESLHFIDFNKNIKLIIDELPFNFLQYRGKYNGDEDLENLDHNFKLARKFKDTEDILQMMVKSEAKRFERYYSVVNDGLSNFNKMNHVHNNTIVMSASYYTMNLYRMYFDDTELVFSSKNQELIEKAIQNIEYVNDPLKGKGVLKINTSKWYSGEENEIMTNKTGSNAYKDICKINIPHDVKFPHKVVKAFGKENVEGLIFDFLQQSIWRSALRDGKKVKIFFEDKELQKLFQEKLEELLKFFKQIPLSK